MSRCEGSTKAGERCKRSAPEGSRFCSAHADSATNTAEETSRETNGAKRAADGARECECVERDVFDALFGLAAAGVVIVAALTLRRFIRIS
ncbi:MAG: hypothetical protein ABFS14_11255 [Gemmatimonadota bacterium]